MTAKVSDACVGCESCVAECPVGAIVIEGGKAIVDAAKCVDCGACTSACPCNAITI